MPKLDSGERAPIADISSRNTLASPASSPPPPYSLGQSGTVQPLSRIRSNQMRCGSDENLVLRPPQKVSPSEVIGLRISGGQLACSQARVSLRNFSRSDISAFPILEIGSTLAVASRNSIYLCGVPCGSSGGHGVRSGVFASAVAIDKPEE